MKELMIHVERIVRPISATQGRKMRMRTELLTHLQDALEEERQARPADEQTMLERAKKRLGEPAELTRTLQQTVPTLERLLLRKLPVSRGFDHWEKQAARRMYGTHRPMTLGHITMLSSMAVLAAAPMFMSVYGAMKSSGMQAHHITASILGTLIGWPLLLVACYRFVFAAASIENHLSAPAMMIRGAVILGLQIGLTCFVTYTIADRAATIGEIINCAAPTLALLAVWWFMARRIAVLRRPYDAWLTLDIAEG